MPSPLKRLLLESDPRCIVEAFADETGLALSDRAVELLVDFTELVARANRRLQLVGRLDPAAIARELVCDSLTLACLTRPSGPIIDVGSGAGFPGIPLAIAFEEVEVVLVEPRRRRNAFLGHASRTLGLSKVRRVRSRIEDAALVDAALACSKAFAPLPRWLEVATSLVAPDGEIGVLCARSDWERLSVPCEGAPALRELEVRGRLDYDWGKGGRTATVLARKS